jgi:nuclease S1
MAAIPIAALLVPHSLCAWGRLGHRTAARIAETRLTPRALAAVNALLGPGVRLADVSTWVEEQEDPKSASWHYVRVPISESAYNPKYCPQRGCVVSKVGEFERVLQDPKTDKVKKQQALRFLVHLITDLHQPFYVGCLDGKGSEGIRVRFYDVASNLGRVWDSQIMERHTTSEQVWLWDFDFHAKSKRVSEWSRGTPENWATESLMVAREAHRLPGARTVIQSGPKLGDEYYAAMLPIIQKQLAKSGIRIAWTLNERLVQAPGLC